jgi:hypothetical protein
MLNQRLDAFLAEKNMVTDLLTKAEKSTGVKKQYIAQGQSLCLCMFQMTVSDRMLISSQA